MTQHYMIHLLRHLANVEVDVLRIIDKILVFTPIFY